MPLKDGSRHPRADVINVFDGFTSWKSRICLDAYGLGSIVFKHAYLLDCAVGFNHEWQRRGEMILEDSIVVGESPNVGNVDAAGVSTTSCR